MSIFNSNRCNLAKFSVKYDTRLKIIGTADKLSVKGVASGKVFHSPANLPEARPPDKKAG